MQFDPGHKNGALKKFEDLRQLGAVMFTVELPGPRTTRERSARRGRIVGRW
jgi:hypothetical protein